MRSRLWGRGREVGQALTATAWESEGSGAEEVQGGVAAGRSDTWEVTSEDADAVVVGGRHGTKKGEGRGLLDGGKTRLESPLEWG